MQLPRTRLIPQSAITIELMHESDLDAVMRIERASFRDPWKRSFFEADFAHPYARLMVVREAGRILGYTIVWHIEDELHIASIAVDPARRRQGIGDRLLGWLITAGREAGCRSIYLEVRPSNLAALGFYRKHGFVYNYTRKGYYPDGEDALILEKSLISQEKSKVQNPKPK